VNQWVGAGSVVDSLEMLGVAVAEKPTLTQARLRAVLSMYELAKKAGVAASTIMDVENGAKPRMKTIRKLAEALGMEPTDIAWPGDPLGALDQDGGDDDE
jgi:transcriptional regulator with XRE-family HTH domain